MIRNTSDITDAIDITVFPTTNAETTLLQQSIPTITIMSDLIK